MRHNVTLAASGLLLLTLAACDQDPAPPPEPELPPLTWQALAASDTPGAMLAERSAPDRCAALTWEGFTAETNVTPDTRQRLLSSPGTCFLESHGPLKGRSPDYDLTALNTYVDGVGLRPREPTPMSPDFLATLGLPVKAPTREFSQRGRPGPRQMLWYKAFPDPCQRQGASFTGWPCSPVVVRFEARRDDPDTIDLVTIDLTGQTLTPVEGFPIRWDDHTLPTSDSAFRLQDRMTVILLPEQVILGNKRVSTVEDGRILVDLMKRELGDEYLRRSKRAALMKSPYDPTLNVASFLPSPTSALLDVLHAAWGSGLPTVHLAVAPSEEAPELDIDLYTREINPPLARTIVVFPRTPDAAPKRGLHVHVGADGLRVSSDGESLQPTTTKALTAAASKDEPALVHVDQDVPYQRLVTTLDALAGANKRVIVLDGPHGR